MRCSKLKTTECCFLRSETAGSKELKEGAGRPTRNDYATVENCWSEYASLAEEEIFVYAFWLGANIAIDILSADYRN